MITVAETGEFIQKAKKLLADEERQALVPTFPRTLLTEQLWKEPAASENSAGHGREQAKAAVPV